MYEFCGNVVTFLDVLSNIICVNQASTHNTIAYRDIDTTLCYGISWCFKPISIVLETNISIGSIEA